MLQILCNGVSIDLLPDTEIELVYENPFMTDTRIPVPFGLSYDLPLSERNKRAFGFPGRPTSNTLFHPVPTVIYFSGIIIARGVQIIEEVSDKITVNFNAAIFPKSIRQYLYRYYLDKLNFGVAETDRGFVNVDRPLAECNTFFCSKLGMGDKPDFVAPTIAIRGLQFPTYGGENLGMKQHYYNFINGYDDGNEYTDLALLPRRRCYLSKILPAFRIGWLLEKILPENSFNNIYNDDENLRRIMLISRFHPKYQIENATAVYDMDRETNEVSISIADFLPEISGSDFVCEMLKIPCATLYINGISYAIEYNKDILRRNVVHNFTHKIMGNLSVSVDKGCIYSFGYDMNEEEIPVDKTLKEVNTIKDMYLDSLTVDSIDNASLYKVRSTGQVFEIEFDNDSDNKWKYKVIKQDLGSFVSPEEDPESDDERSVYENKLSCEVLHTNLRRYFLRSHESNDTNPDLKRFYYLPEGDPIEKSRSKNMTLGIYHGRADLIVYTGVTGAGRYPYMSHCNYDAFGNRVGGMSLSFSGEDGLMKKYHSEFKEWIEKDKKIVRCQVALDVRDLNRLDLRDKFNVQGRNYFIKNLTVRLSMRSIAPADAEFIEV